MIKNSEEVRNDAQHRPQAIRSISQLPAATQYKTQGMMIPPKRLYLNGQAKTTIGLVILVMAHLFLQRANLGLAPEGAKLCT